MVKKSKTESRYTFHKRGTVRPLDLSDPRSPDHPSHDEAWLVLARALGRALADYDWDRINGPEKGTK